MKYQINDFQKLINRFDWNTTKLADALSAIGHETEIVSEKEIDVTLTTNRPDCKKLDTLAFDLSGVYNLPFTGTKPDVAPIKTVNVTISDINKILGTDIPESTMGDLSRLGFVVDSATVKVPAYRTDISEKADIAEEVARIYGFQNIAPKPLTDSPVKPSDDYYRKLRLKIALAEAGLSETLTYSFTGEKNDWELDQPHNADEKFLRSNLLVGLLKTVAKNPYLKRGGFFEVGDIFKYEEIEFVGVIIYGYKDKAREKIINTAEKALQCKEKIEVIAIDQKTLDKYNVKQSHVYFFEVPIASCEAVYEPIELNYNLSVFKPISKFPPTVRDFTLINISPVKTSEIIAKSLEKFDELVIVEKIDEYTNKETGQSSVTIRFIIQKMEGNFTDLEIEGITQAISDFLKPYGNGNI